MDVIVQFNENLTKSVNAFEWVQCQIQANSPQLLLSPTKLNHTSQVQIYNIIGNLCDQSTSFYTDTDFYPYSYADSSLVNMKSLTSLVQDSDFTLVMMLQLNEFKGRVPSEGSEQDNFASAIIAAQNVSGKPHIIKTYA